MFIDKVPPENFSQRLILFFILITRQTKKERIINL